MSEESTLSEREEEILALVATGLSNREIAQALYISPNTVKVHLSHIFEKLSVSSRTEATLHAIEHGLVDMPGGEVRSEVQQPRWQDLLRQYVWLWGALFVLLLLFSVTFSTNVLFPPPTPGPTLAEMSQRWQELTPMPGFRVGMAAAAYDGDIYAIAGQGPEGVRGEVFRYSPEVDAWEVLADKPTPVADVQGALLGERIYVPGGVLGNGQPTDILEIYDPRRDTWERGTPMPKAVSAYALASFEGQLYLFGGWDGVNTLDDVMIYDPGADVWQMGTSMSVARRDAGAVALTDKIVVLGGRKAEDALSQAQAYFPSRDVDGEQAWESFPDLPEPRSGIGLAAVSDTIYVFGGENNQDEGQIQMGFVFSGEEWSLLSIDWIDSSVSPKLVTVGPLLYFLDTSVMEEKVFLWSYWALIFEIFIPIVQ